MSDKNAMIKEIPFSPKRPTAPIELVVNSNSDVPTVLRPKEVSANMQNDQKHVQYVDKLQKSVNISTQMTYRLFDEDHPNDGITRLVRNDGYRNQITPNVMSEISSELTDVANKLIQSFGLSCCRVYTTTDEDSAEIKICISTVNAIGMDKFAHDFLAHATEFNLKPEHYGRKVVIDDVQYLITGLDLISRLVRTMGPEGNKLMSAEDISEHLISEDEKPVTINY